MTDNNFSHDLLIQRLGMLANQSLPLWHMPKGTKARLINLSENATYLIENRAGYRSILRIHREGYHSLRAIECELAWMRSLNDCGDVITSNIIVGLNSKDIQQAGISGLLPPRLMVMFEFIEGIEPNQNHDLIKPFEELGKIAAKTHSHSINWKLPDKFERLSWDFQHMLGDKPNWGDWRAAPAMDNATRKILKCQEKIIYHRLNNFGKDANRYGLIHADMRLANLLIHNDTPRLIDFDDCGFGWFMYDFAASISFMEDHPQVPDLKDAWLKGYSKIRKVSAADEQEIDTFIMLRRMVLLAWIGSHLTTDLAKKQAVNFARVSAELAEKYLSKFT